MAKEEKNGLRPVIACVLMVIMLCCALIIGARKGWTKEQNALQQYREAVLESVQARVETAYNLLTVAGRYMSADDTLYAAVKDDLQSLENGKTTFSVVSTRQFQLDAQALLKALAERTDVQADARDNMYVTQMLPQAVEMCMSSDAITAYNEAASDCNDRMHSFSGMLARLTGMQYAALFEDGAQSTAN